MEDLRKKIRTVPNFPKEGIMYKDITPLLADPKSIKEMLTYFDIRYRGRKVDKVVGIESRGFIIGSLVANKLGVGFVPVRKAGKLPSETERVDYTLEYGMDSLEIHRDSIQPGEKVLLVDDLLATGGTAKAAVQLIESLGGQVVECSFLINLRDLPGKQKLNAYDIFSLLEM
tara:strand:+ start:1737 stop:2252 length:516 start_codon:yes stop_codon:yes gene_type:complete